MVTSEQTFRKAKALSSTDSYEAPEELQGISLIFNYTPWSPLY